MESRKGNKFRPALRQRISLRIVLVTGISILTVTVLLVIYFQFSQNEVSKAKNVPDLTGTTLPVEMVIGEKVTLSADTLSRNGIRYKVARPLTQTSATVR